MSLANDISSLSNLTLIPQLRGIRRCSVVYTISSFVGLILLIYNGGLIVFLGINLIRVSSKRK